MGARNHKWTPDDIAYLIEHSETMTDRQMGYVLGMSESAVYNKRYRLGISMVKSGEDRRWNFADIAYVQKHHKKMTPDEIGRNIGRSEKATYQRMLRMGLSRVYKRIIRYEFSQEEDQYIIDHYVADGGRSVAEHLGIDNRAQVNSRVSILRASGKMVKPVSSASIKSEDIDRRIAEREANDKEKIDKLPHMDRPDRGAIPRVLLPPADITVSPSADAIMVAISRLKGEKLHDFRVRYRLYMARLHRACSTGMPIVSPKKEFKSIVGE